MPPFRIPFVFVTIIAAVLAGRVVRSNCAVQDSDESNQVQRISDNSSNSRLPLSALAVVALNHSPAASDALASLAQQEPVRYGRDIRPILSDRCFLCHGPDRAKQQASLRLDIREEAIAPREDGAAIVPYDAQASQLWMRISSHDPDVMMPTPESAKRPLSTDEQALLRRWIEEGASYESHWAFSPPQTAQIPALRDSEWPRNDIDRFVLASMERAGVAPSTPTDDSSLLRRVFLDLTGLPPTPAETDAYLADVSPDRYEQLVQRLMTEEPYASRHAERMAVPWLDIARYADTSGIHMDAGRQMWLWRDWVINAFRSNKPYDQFIIEQLAGDLIPNATVDQLVASGFNRAHVTSDEGGAIDEEYRLEYAVDRVNTTGAAFLGLSVGCARCHDHKFDPVTTEDFYSLVAFFNSNEEPGIYSQLPDAYRALEPSIDVPRPEDAPRLAILAQAEARARAEQDGAGEAEKADLALFVADTRAGVHAVPVTITSAHSRDGATLTAQADGSVLASGTSPARDEHTIVLRTDARDMRLIMLEALTDATLAQNRVGRAPNGNAVLDSIEVEAISLRDPAQTEKVNLVWAWADYEQENGDFHVVNALTKGEGRQWAVRSHEVEGSRTAFFAAEKPFGFDGGTELRITLNYDSPYDQHMFGRVRVTPMQASEAALARLPEATSGWYIVGPFFGESGAAYTTNYGPESATRFVRGEKFGTEAASDAWRFAPTVLEAQAVGLAASVGCEFIGRQIYSPDARTIELSFGSDDGLMVYLNGVKVHETVEPRSVAPDQDRVSLHLVAGENFLVCKVVNTGGNAAFFHRALPRDGVFDPRMVALIASDESVRPAVRDAATNAWRIRFSPSYIAAAAKIDAVAAERNTLLATTPKTMVMKESAMARPTYVQTRGAYDQADMNRPVSRAVPKVLGALPEGAPQNRLGLAQWIVSAENPLTARVTVNRVWETMFGNGIVRTSDDFGMQGEWPTNEALLDYLAVRFRNGGWNMRELVRDIVTSATYRQSSRVRSELAVADPSNRLLSYFPRSRLSAEQIRDQALYVGGLLREKVGGPSVKPYQPEGLWQEVAMLQSNTREYEQGMGDDLWRRSLYTYWKRAAPPPTMLTFDAPTREFCATRRLITNTPLQALALWNDPQFVEAARGAAERTLRESNDDAARLELLFRRATGVRPSRATIDSMREMLEQNRARYVAAPAEAAQFLAVGATPVAADMDSAELAAWTLLANAVLSSDATIVKD